MKENSEQIRIQRRADFYTYYCSPKRGLGGEHHNICLADAKIILEFFENYEDAILREETEGMSREVVLSDAEWVKDFGNELAMRLTPSNETMKAVRWVREELKHKLHQLQVTAANEAIWAHREGLIGLPVVKISGCDCALHQEDQEEDGHCRHCPVLRNHKV